MQTARHDGGDGAVSVSVRWVSQHVVAASAEGAQHRAGDVCGSSSATREERRPLPAAGDSRSTEQSSAVTVEAYTTIEAMTAPYWWEGATDYCAQSFVSSSSIPDNAAESITHLFVGDMHTVTASLRYTVYRENS